MDWRKGGGNEGGAFGVGIGLDARGTLLDNDFGIERERIGLVLLLNDLEIDLDIEGDTDFDILLLTLLDTALLEIGLLYNDLLIDLDMEGDNDLEMLLFTLLDTALLEIGLLYLGVLDIAGLIAGYALVEIS